MSETPRLYVHYRPVNGLPRQVKQRPATPDEIRAAVVPLLDLEAAKLAAMRKAEQIAHAQRNGRRFSLTECNDMKIKAAVYAALGLGEPTSQRGGET